MSTAPDWTNRWVVIDSSVMVGVLNTSDHRHVQAKRLVNEQMERRRFTPEQQAAVHRTLAQLEESHRDALQALIATGAIEMPAASP